MEDFSVASLPSYSFGACLGNDRIDGFVISTVGRNLGCWEKISQSLCSFEMTGSTGLSFRPAGEFLFDGMEDFSVALLLRNDRIDGFVISTVGRNLVRRDGRFLSRFAP